MAKGVDGCESGGGVVQFGEEEDLKRYGRIVWANARYLPTTKLLRLSAEETFGHDSD